MAPHPPKACLPRHLRVVESTWRAFKMAFLCPVRIRRGKKKKEGGTKDVPMRGPPSLGRITGSASIETLVRVGLEKEAGFGPDSKMVVLHDFTPCVDDELEVKRGCVVNVLYRENDWVYVISEQQQEGFIPHSYCAAYGSQLGDLAMSNVKKKLPREPSSSGDGGGGGGGGAGEGEGETTEHGTGAMEGSDNDSYGGGMCSNKQASPQAQQQGQAQSQTRTSQISLHSNTTTASQPDIHPFFKDPAGRYIVLYTFTARDENDVSVERGEFVTVLNREDPDWFWIVRADGQEGFVPSAFVYPAEVVQGHINLNQANNQNQSNYSLPSNNHGNHHLASPSTDDLRYHGTELVMLYDYKAQAPDDLSVRRGDWIYADLGNQTVEGWLWAYAPKTRKYGFIPKAYARPPAMTSL